MGAEDPRRDGAAQKILAGTMKALSRQGAHKLSVSDICESSQIARGTFYRYFNSKDEVLAALGQHFEDGVAAALAAAVEANPDPERRVQVVLDTILAYRASGGDWGKILDVAPEFTITFIRDTFPRLVDIVTEALGPAVEESPLVASGTLAKRQLGELFMRSVISMLFLPGSRSDEVPALMVSLFKVETKSAARPQRQRKASA